MNYYQRHIGDYIKDAGHLSLLEHGVFARLLDVYYGREAPIPDDQKYRLIMARTDEEKTTVDAILLEFFKFEGDAWRNKRCDEEIFKAQEKSRKASESAGTRWENTARNANAMPTQCEGNAPNSHKPITTNQITTTPLPPKGDGGPAARTAKPKRKAVDHSEGLPIPETLKAIPGFESTWRDRCDQRYAKPTTRFPTATAAEKELAQLAGCRDPVDVLNRAIAGSWQGLNIKPSDKRGWVPGQAPGAPTAPKPKLSEDEEFQRIKHSYIREFGYDEMKAEASAREAIERMKSA